MGFKPRFSTLFHVMQLDHFSYISAWSLAILFHFVKNFHGKNRRYYYLQVKGKENGTQRLNGLPNFTH